MAATDRTADAVAPWARVAILIASLIAATGLSLTLTGSIVPTGPADALIFQSTLLVVVLGSAVIEHKFTKPADSVVNALMRMVSLVTVFGIAPRTPWLLVFGYCAIVFLLSLTCVVASTSPETTGWRRTIADWTYRPAVVFGRARLLYSLVFLFAVFTFYGVQAPRTAVLVMFWGLFLALWPLGLPELLSSWTPRSGARQFSGKVVRVDAPNLVRVELQPSARWNREQPMAYKSSEGKLRTIIPLYKQEGQDQAIGTGLVADLDDMPASDMEAGHVYEDSHAFGSEIALTKQLGGEDTSILVGFVIEDSRIGAIRFETRRSDMCRDGLLVWCMVGDRKVFYQITEGVTREENLNRDRHGYHFAIAAQLGALDATQGFVKHDWLPAMNSPVFCEPTDFGDTLGVVKDGDFVFGTIPGTAIQIGGPFTAAMDHHTAILGVTGAGKTELAFDLIRHAVNSGLKVICIDLTARYEDHLADLAKTNLSIEAKLAADLDAKLFDADTGAYGGGKEKQELRKFAARLKDDVTKKVQAFLKSNEGAEQLGVITLDEISNTKASLFVTELYMSCLLGFARENPKDCPRVLVVVDEAHTVMPEPSTMGLADYDSRGLVGKIAQIALQGRKYGIGLLVIAQRTATVSKTILTQCNTIVAFSCLDQTSIEFLANAMGDIHANGLPNMPSLTAVVCGKAVRSQKPIVVKIPFNEAKVNAATAKQSGDAA